MKFDTLEYIHKLKACGVPEEQAEVHARAIIEVVESNLATKQDIAEIKRDMTGHKRDMQELDIRLKYDLTLRLGGMMAASIALMAAMGKLL
jgi:uncharacterized membrane protein YqiK